MRTVVRMLIVLGLFASSLSATVFQPTTDRDLIDRSQLIVVATVLDAGSHLRNDGYVATDYHLAVEETLKGPAANTITVSEIGGVVDGRFTFVADSANYAPGERVLAFLKARGDGTWFTTSMAMGKFTFTRSETGKLVVARTVSEMDNDPVRSADVFEDFVRNAANTTEAYATKLTPIANAFHPIATAAASAYTLVGCGSPGCFPVRVVGGESGGGLTFKSTGSLSGVDGPGGIANAAASWTTDPNSGIVLSYSGTIVSSTPDPDDGQSIVYLGYSGPDNGICDSALACAFGAGGSTHTYKGETFISITDADIIVRPGIGASLYATLITHEIGHAIGLRHSDAGTPSSSSAVMTSSVNSAFGFNLQSWDQEAISVVYGNGPACTNPAITVQPAANTTITSGQQVTLTVTATGTSPTYQWYKGNSGDTSNQIAGATSSSITDSPAANPTKYWVRVSGCSTFVNSNTATVTVNQPVCVPPSAPQPNASPSSIPNGQSSTLSVSPSGTSPFTYQWYVGNSGVTTSPIGGATNSFVTVSPTADTKYWVRVTGQCAPASDSPATTVTVTCSPISPAGVFAQPNTITAGQSSTLFFSTAGTGPFTIQWYTGGPGDTSNPIVGATNTSTVVSPTLTTGYWVHVSAPCGSQDGSVIVSVTGAPCIAPSITTQPASSSISAGSQVTVTVAAGGSAPLTVQWYTGDKGDVSHPIAGATSFSLTQSPSVTTKYWARVSNTCSGTQTADSNAATITVTVAGPICTSPSITTQPANVSAPIGTAATLHVVAGGTTPLHYQWFKGVKGDTSKPVGTDSATFISGAISSNTSFWVHVTGQCGNAADSNAAAVTAIAPPRAHAARH